MYWYYFLFFIAAEFLGFFSLYESSHHTDNQKVNIQNWTCKQCVESNWFETNVCTLYIRHLSRLEFAWEWKWQCRHSFAKTCLRFTFQKRKLFHAIWKNCRGIRRAEISRSMHSCVRRRRDKHSNRLSNLACLYWKHIQRIASYVINRDLKSSAFLALSSYSCSTLGSIHIHHWPRMELKSTAWNLLEIKNQLSPIQFQTTATQITVYQAIRKEEVMRFWLFFEIEIIHHLQRQRIGTKIEKK